MCDPVIALSVVSTVVGFIGQQQQASAQHDAIQADYNNKQATLNQQAQQTNAAATADMSERSRQAMIERGRLQVIGAESGLGTGNLDRTTQQSEFNQGFDIATIEGNRKNAIAQNTLDSTGAYAQAQSRSNAVRQPSLIGAGLQIAGAGADYMNRQQQVGRVGKPTGID